MKKNNIIVDCERCKCTSSEAPAGFEVKVPICDVETGVCKNAILRCVVTAEKHEVGFQDWEGEAAVLSDDLAKRIEETLDFISDQRICGNENICPTEVIKIVKRLSSG
jgi:hypothetical protein